MLSSICRFSSDVLHEADQLLCGMQSTARALRIMGRRRFAIGGSAPAQQTQVFLRVLDHSAYRIVLALLVRGRRKSLRSSGENLREWDAAGWLCLGECAMLLAARNVHKGYAPLPHQCLQHSCILCLSCFVNCNQLSEALLT